MALSLCNYSPRDLIGLDIEHARKLIADRTNNARRQAIDSFLESIVAAIEINRTMCRR